ncbi:MAG: spermidine/putrescine ABC transporter ATP-binding protein [Candidatus Hecatellales archaeon]|nr:MAG: spermidine/putrescine ABC transporter ATP-binding protein [Candidatus Hecatellales archaeon]
MEKAAVQVEGLTKKFGNTTAVNNITFQVNKGEFFVIVGPSPSGKTTLLKCIIGIEKPDAGKIYINGVNVEGLPPYKRDVSLVFQDFAIFPHMTVRENIAFGLKMRGYDEAKIARETEEIMKLVGLEGLGDRRPTQLSGGQQQRVALARSLIIKPSVLLLDEPMANLDFKLQQKMEIELKRLQKKLGITFIYVTHSREQAMILADRILVLNRGMVEQIGTPTEIYNNPATVFVAKFIGDINMFKGEVVKIDEQVSVRTEIGELKGTLKEKKLEKGTKLVYAVRPEKIYLGDEAKECENKIESKYMGSIYRGSDVTILVQLKDGREFRIEKGGEEGLLGKKPGESLLIGWNPEDAMLLDKPSIVPGVDFDSVMAE